MTLLSKPSRRREHVALAAIVFGALVAFAGILSTTIHFSIIDDSANDGEAAPLAPPPFIELDAVEIRTTPVTEATLGSVAEAITDERQQRHAGADDAVVHHNRVARHVHALTAEWTALRMRFITPQPPSAPTETPGPMEDTLACSTAGQFIGVGTHPPANRSIACNSSLRENCWAVCDEEHLMNPTRANNIGLALQRVGALLDRRLLVQPTSASSSFSQFDCGHFNVSGFFVGNAFVVVTVRPEFSPLLYSLTRQPCTQDPGTRRPLLFHFNVAPRLGDNVSAAQNVVFRALLHGLGLTTDMMPLWLVPNSAAMSYRDTDPARYPTGPIAGNNVTFINNTLQVATPRQPTQNVRLVTPRAVEAARAHFACPSLDSVPLEDKDFDGLLFFEKRVLRGEILTREDPFSEVPLRFTPVSFGALLDTGWYTAAADSAASAAGPLAAFEGRLEWGRAVGCGFVQVRCSLGGWPPHYFCMDRSAAPACGFDRTFSGTCNNKFLGYSIPEEYRIFQNSLVDAGSDQFADHCPYVEPFAPSRNGLGFCTSTTQVVDEASALPTGFRLSADSRCFIGTVGNQSARNADLLGPAPVRSQLAACYQVVCVGSVLQPIKTIMTRVGNVFVPCLEGLNFTFVRPRADTSESGEHVIENPQLSGYVLCGTNMQAFCDTPGVLSRSSWPSIGSITPPRGPMNGGILVTISGSSLVFCSAVRIGGVVTRNVVYNFPTAALHVLTPFIPGDMGSAAADGLGPTDVELFCSVKDVCDEGCFVARLQRGFTLTVLEPCNMTSDVINCNAMPICTWNGTHCEELIVTDAPTPEPIMTPVPLSFVDPRCAISAPFFCTNTHRCAPSPDLCLECSAPYVQCWNSECRRNLADCDCPPELPFRCARTNRCLRSQVHCDLVEAIACNASHPFRCFDGECAARPSRCASCPREAPFRCNETSDYCVGKLSECQLPAPQQCPLDRCLFEPCVTTSLACPCPHGAGVRCWDNACRATASECQCDNERPHRCPAARTEGGGACAVSPAFCPLNATRIPCEVSQFHCTNEQCAANQFECPCSIRQAALVRVMSMPQRVAYDSWTRIAADVRLTPCAIDRSATVRLAWVVEELTSRVPVPIRGELLIGPVLHIPPMALSPGKTYMATVTATTSDSRSSVGNVTIVAFAPAPLLSITGGDRDVPGSSTLHLEAVVVDSNFQDGVIRWACCVANTAGEACIESRRCPALFDAVTDIRTLRVRIASSSMLPLGAFIFTATYKSIARSVLITVRDEPVPVCNLVVDSQVSSMQSLPSFVYSNVPLVVHAEVQFAGSTTAKWSVNGTIVNTATELMLTLPSGALPVAEKTTIGLTVTTDTDQISRCSIVVVPIPPPLVGLCGVSNESPDDGVDYQSNLGTAGRSTLRLSTFGWGVLGGDQLERTNSFHVTPPIPIWFRFGYIDATSRVIFLSPEFSPAPLIEFTAPLMLRNPSLIATRFVVEAAAVVSAPWDASSPQKGSFSAALVLRNTTCTADIKSSSDRTTQSLVEDLYATVIQAATTNNLPQFLLRSARLVSVLQDTDLVASRVVTICRDVLQRFHALVSVGVGAQSAANATSIFRGHPLSPTIRSVGLDVLHMLTQFLDNTFTLLPSFAGMAPVPGDDLQPSRQGIFDLPRTFSVGDASTVAQVLHHLLQPRDGDVADLRRDLAKVEALLQWSHDEWNSTSTYALLVKLVAAALPVQGHRSISVAPRASSTATMRSPIFPGTSFDRQQVTLVASHATPTTARSMRAWTPRGPQRVADIATGNAAVFTPDALSAYPQVILPSSATFSTVSPLEHIFMQLYVMHNGLPTRRSAGLQDLVSFIGASPVSVGNRTVFTDPTAEAMFVAPVAPILGFDMRVGVATLSDSVMTRHLLRSGTTGSGPGGTVATRRADGLPSSEDAISAQELLEKAFNETGARLRFVVDITRTRMWYPTGRTTNVDRRNVTCYFFSAQEQRWLVTAPAAFVALDAPARVPLFPSSSGAAASLDTADVIVRAVVECPARQQGFYGVFDRAQYPIATPAPTPIPEENLRSNVIALARSLSGGVIAAIVLGSVVFAAGVAYLVYLRRERRVAEAVEQENKQTSELLLVSDLLTTDEDLRMAMEVARVRRLYESDL